MSIDTFKTYILNEFQNQVRLTDTGSFNAYGHYIAIPEEDKELVQLLLTQLKEEGYTAENVLRLGRNCIKISQIPPTETERFQLEYPRAAIFLGIEIPKDINPQNIDASYFIQYPPLAEKGVMRYYKQGRKLVFHSGMYIPVDIPQGTGRVWYLDGNHNFIPF